MMNPNLTTTKPKFQAFSGVRVEHLLAGISGGVASTLLLHPLDLMKIRFAVSDVNPSSSASSASTAPTPATAPARPQYNGLTHAMVQVFRDEGIKGLYRGVTPNVWGAGSAWGLYFLFYNTIKTWYQGGNAKVHIGPTLHMVAAAEAGILTLVMTNPIWVVKTRLCLQFESSSASANVAADPHRYKGMVDAFVKTYKYEGMRGLYKGFVPGVFGVSHGALQFMAYEEFKAQYNRYRNLPIDARLTSFEYLSFAALSKLFAAVTTYPYQVLRARMQDQHSQYINLRHCIKETFRRNGIVGYYKGMYPYLLRMVPATAITFLTYEKVLQLLQRFTEKSESQSDKKDEKSQ